jgi:hypothetical protein
LAGKYAGPARAAVASKAIEGLGAVASSAPAGSKRAAMARTAMGPLADLINRGIGPETAAAVGVPLAAGLAGVGGMAAGMGLGALGVPGFQQGMAIDPEGYSSNNTPSAQFGVKSLASTQYV